MGWKGGKRRLLSRLRPWFPVDNRPFAEPFVGMGALLLDMRARGWRGVALVADTNPEVRDFWDMVHDRTGNSLVAEAGRLFDRFEDGPKESDWWALLEERPTSDEDRVARFLWLVNYAHANQSVRWTGNGWYRTRGTGTKLKSAAKWSKTFPWSACVKRLENVVAACNGLPVVVRDDAEEVLFGRVYADPPYLDRADYACGGGETFDWAQNVFSWKVEHIVLSETRELSPPPGWRIEVNEVVARSSASSGAIGKRTERLYLSPGCRA